jgi:hypothetical protein
MRVQSVQPHRGTLIAGLIALATASVVLGTIAAAGHAVYHPSVSIREAP